LPNLEEIKAQMGGVGPVDSFVIGDMMRELPNILEEGEKVTNWGKLFACGHKKQTDLWCGETIGRSFRSFSI
jgi:hypothetical protein